MNAVIVDNAKDQDDDDDDLFVVEDNAPNEEYLVEVRLHTVMHQMRTKNYDQME